MSMQDYQDCNAAERDVLYTLRADGPMTGREIMRACGRSEAAVSRALRALDDRGWINRVDADDVPGPSKRNRLTDVGEAVTTAAFEAHGAAL